MKTNLNDSEIEELAKQVLSEMTDWLIYYLMDLRYHDSLKVIKRVNELFQQHIKDHPLA